MKCNTQERRPGCCTWPLLQSFARKLIASLNVSVKPTAAPLQSVLLPLKISANESTEPSVRLKFVSCTDISPTPDQHSLDGGDDSLAPFHGTLGPSEEDRGANTVVNVTGWEGTEKAENTTGNENNGREAAADIGVDNRDETMGASLGAAGQGHLVGVSVHTAVA